MAVPPESLSKQLLGFDLFGMQIISSPYLPLEVTGYRRKAIMAHPLIRPLLSLLRVDEFVCWGPWEEIKRPVAFAFGRKLVMPPNMINEVYKWR